jgi:hypothetical protein
MKCSVPLLFYSINHNLLVRTRTRNTPFEKRASPQATQDSQQAARHTAGSKAERKEEKERGSGAGVSAGVAETGVRPFNSRYEGYLFSSPLTVAIKPSYLISKPVFTKIVLPPLSIGKASASLLSPILPK